MITKVVKYPSGAGLLYTYEVVVLDENLKIVDKKKLDVADDIQRYGYSVGSLLPYDYSLHIGDDNAPMYEEIEQRIKAGYETDFDWFEKHPEEREATIPII